MIRKYCTIDLQSITHILQQGMILDNEVIESSFSNPNTDIIVYEDSKKNILGFSSLRIWNKKDKYGEIIVYVKPNERHRGIGTALYNEITESTSAKELSMLDVVFRTDKDDAADYFTSKGYEKWYNEITLIYKGCQQRDTGIKLVPYEDKYFKIYGEGLRNSFYHLREANDFKPYYCCEMNDKTRQAFLDEGDIFLLFEGSSLVGSIRANTSGFVEDLYVISDYRRGGYGRKLMQQAIHMEQQMNCQQIRLSAIDWNTPALGLYHSLGFQDEQAMGYYRKFL